MAVRPSEAASPSNVEVANLAVSVVAGIPGVIELDGGTFGEFATFGPGERVAGVRVRTDAQPNLTLQVVARYGQVLRDLADEVRTRVIAELATRSPALGSAAVDVHIVDVATAPRKRPPRSETQSQPGIEAPATGPSGTVPASAAPGVGPGAPSAAGPPSGAPEQLGLDGPDGPPVPPPEPPGRAAGVDAPPGRPPRPDDPSPSFPAPPIGPPERPSRGD